MEPPSLIAFSDHAIWLYGSHSRGDPDRLSDLDVLLVAANETDKISLAPLEDFSVAPSVSRYTWDEIESMAKYGSLFLQHVAMEGRPIFESPGAAGRLKSLLLNLRPYQLAVRDIKGFFRVHSDVAGSLSSDDASLIFEASTLATVFRHACILGCSLIGEPCFSRAGPVARLVLAWDLPAVWSKDFPALYRYRLFADSRVAQVERPSSSYVWSWHERTGELLNEIMMHIDEQI
jgi:hypothetical protein